MWNGEGFPPVGTECEFKYFGSWMRGKVIVSEENRICVTNGSYGLSANNLSDIRPIKTEWNGEGFPPAGTYCDVKYRNEWISCFIVGMDDLGNCVARNDSVYIATRLTEDFRPLRTERQMTQGDMLEIARVNPAASMIELFGLFHDAGYRK